MLDIDEEGLEVGRIGEPCDLAAERADEEPLRQFADLIDVEHRVMAKGLVDRSARNARIAGDAMIGLHPHAALRVDAEAIGAGECGAVDVADQVAPPAASVGSPACRKISQLNLVASGESPSSLNLMMWPCRLVTRGFAGSVTRRPLLLVSVQKIALLSGATVSHSGRSITVPPATRAADWRFDQHVGLVVEVDDRRRRRGRALADIAGIRGTGGQAVLPDDQRAPLARAVAVEACDIERAIVEQFGVRGAVRRAERTVGNEFIDAARRVVVTHVKGDAIVAVLHEGDIFVVEAAHRGALGRLGQFAQQIDFDHPAIIGRRLRRIEIIVHRLFAGEIGIPWRAAARTIVQHALDRARQQASGGAAGAVVAEARITAVIGRSGLDRPFAVAALGDFDDADADRRQPERVLLGGRGVFVILNPRSGC